MANEYSTVAAVKNALELGSETFADSDIARALTSASRGIDALCDRRFYPDTDATQVRYYSAEPGSTVAIDDLITLTSLATGDGDGSFATSWTENTDFVLEPLNAAADGKPWTHITATGQQAWPCGTRTVKVTGKFGWAAVPIGVEQATIILTAKLVRRAREAPFGVVGVGLDTAMRIARSDPDVMFLVGDMIRNPVVIA